MSDSRPEATAQTAVIQLREAILDILMQCREEGRLVGPTELTELTGLPGGERTDNRHWPAWSFLQELVAEGRVIQHPRRGYELTEEEYHRRRNNL